MERVFEGGACISGDEAAVRIREAALPRTEEERASAVCHLRVGQSVSQSAETAAEDKRITAGEPLFALRWAMAKPRNPRGMSSTPLGELRQDPAFPDRRNLLDQKTYLFRESLGLMGLRPTLNSTYTLQLLIP